VVLIKFVYVLFLVIFVAVIRSHVNHSLIFLSHLAVISSLVWFSSWIILSQCSVFCVGVRGVVTYMEWDSLD
jgi:hypothetical protein